MGFCCRLLAICLLVLALVPWGARDSSHVLVLGLDGVTLSELEELGRNGDLPNITKVIARSRAVPIVGGDRRDPRAFWTTALSTDSGATGIGTYVWTVAVTHGFSVAAVGVPGTTELIDRLQAVVPGANESEGFVGDNVGLILDPSANVAALGWPYDGAASQAALAAAALAPGSASDWLPVAVTVGDVERTGAFRIHKLSDGWLWVSPVYRFVRNARSYVLDAPEELFYVADDPAWTSRSGRLRDYYLQHEDDLANGRSQLAALFASQRRALVVYFDPSIGLIKAVYSGRAEPAVLRAAYHALDQRVGSLIASVPDSTSVALVGRSATGSSAAANVASLPTGFLAIGGSAVGATACGSGYIEVGRVGESLLAALPRAPASSRRKEDVVSLRSEGELPLTPESLRQLGLLSSTSNASSAAADDARDAVTLSSPSAR